MAGFGGSVFLRSWYSYITVWRLFSSSDMPVIRVARRTQLWLQKVEKRQTAPVVVPKAGKLLISTRRRALNQGSVETYCRWEKPILVSRGWKHRKSCGDYFTINRQREQRVWPETENTFRAINLDLRVVLALDASNITTPTWVQNEVIPSLIRGRNVLCASETGSGKTLAYLLPIMHKLLNDVSSGNPRSLILVPSRELADQVASVACKLGSHLGITVQFIGGGRGRRLTEKQLQGMAVDILVATPGILWKLLNWNKMSLAGLQYIVLDEADTLFDKTFCKLTESILMHAPIASHAKEAQGHQAHRKAQLAIIGATFPKGVEEILTRVMDLGSIHIIKSTKLHSLMLHVQHTFKRVTGADKVPELLQMLKQHAVEEDKPGIFIFCNTSKTVNWLSYILDDHGIKHTRLHGQMPAEMRLGVFETFQKMQTDVLVCTNIASRGLDSCRVGTVVNFDFPSSIEDYLHRAGRVGRVGSKNQGSVLSFVTHSWDVEQVQRIENAVRKRTYLPSMKSKINDSVLNKNIIEN